MIKKEFSGFPKEEVTQRILWDLTVQHYKKAAKGSECRVDEVCSWHKVFRIISWKAD